MADGFPTQIVVAALVERDGLLLINQRRLDDHFPGQWEFPGGKVEPGESPAQALRRECCEELGVEVAVEAIHDVIFHHYDTFSVLLLFYKCRILEGEPRPIECERIEWASPAQLSEYDFLPGDRVLIEKLQREAG